MERVKHFKKKIFVKTETQIMIVIYVSGKNKYFFWGVGVI